MLSPTHHDPHPTTLTGAPRPSLLGAGLACAALLAACADPAPGAAEHPEDTSATRDAQAGVQADVDAVLAALAALDTLVHHGQLTSQLQASYDRIELAIVAMAEAAQELRAATAGAAELRQLSIKAGQLAPRLRELTRAIARGGLDRAARDELRTAVARLRVAARSLNHSVGAYHAELHPTELSALAALVPGRLRNGPLFPGAPYYVLDEGHVDVVDAHYEDGELEIAIHDETVDPDVERDPAHVILVVKPEAKLQVPDARFAFLGPVGRDVWVLPEGQLEAEAAGILWPGLSSEEVEPGTFVGDVVQLRFRQVIGPDGLSLFESPQDETTPPVIAVDSEDGLPDTISLSAGTHRHLNWAFEAPGLYFVKVDVRGRLAGVPGNPWVTSSAATLIFAVLP